MLKKFLTSMLMVVIGSSAANAITNDCPGTCGLHHFTPTGAAVAGVFTVTTVNPAGYADITITAVQINWGSTCGLNGVECERATCSIGFQIVLNASNISGGAGTLEVGFFDARGNLYAGGYRDLNSIQSLATVLTEQLKGTCGTDLHYSGHIADPGGDGQASNLYEPGSGGNPPTGLGIFGVDGRCTFCES